MTSELTAAQHTYKGLLKFIFPNDTVTVDSEVMTLTGVHVYKRDKNCIEKQFFPWSEKNTPPPEFSEKVRETQGQKTKEFWEPLLNKIWYPILGQSLHVNSPNLPN